MTDIEYIKDLMLKESGIPKHMFEYDKSTDCLNHPNENKIVKFFEPLFAYIRCQFGKHTYEWQGKSYKGYDWYECPYCHKQFRKYMNKYIEL